MKCIKGYEVKPLKSAAGYYLGTVDEEGFPNCRVSQKYARTKKAAESLSPNRQHVEENLFCNGGCGCFKQ